VETGNADLGFVALSQMRGAGGAFWLVPPTLHSPIRQDAVLLGRSAGSEAARAFMDFLREPGAVAVIEAYGYEILR
jgi:molybdate transport system substrate-binding protein